MYLRVRVCVRVRGQLNTSEHTHGQQESVRAVQMAAFMMPCGRIFKAEALGIAAPQGPLHSVLCLQEKAAA